MRTLPIPRIRYFSASCPEEVAGLIQSQGCGVSFFDVDDTLITPCSQSFLPSCPYRLMIDEIKAFPERFDDPDLLVSRWRLKRKVRLVSPKWPNSVSYLRQAMPVYALTHIDMGTVGEISSMEEWRYEEMKGLGLSFSPHRECSTFLHVLGQNMRFFPVCHEGIFMTGPWRKSKVIKAIAPMLTSRHIALVDDLEQNIEDLGRLCHREGIAYTGILFKGTELLDDGKADAELARFQRDYLLEHKVWLEDDEARELMLPLDPSIA